jgi:hypothetical protein
LIVDAEVWSAFCRFPDTITCPTGTVTQGFDFDFCVVPLGLHSGRRSSSPDHLLLFIAVPLFTALTFFLHCTVLNWTLSDWLSTHLFAVLCSELNWILSKDLTATIIGMSPSGYV